MNRIDTIKVALLAILINDGGRFTFANVDAIVGVKQLKTGNPYKDAEITKRTVYNIFLNGSYKNMVIAKRYKEAIEQGMNEEEAQEFAQDFTPKATWFHKVNDTFNGSIVAKNVKEGEEDSEFYLFFAVNAQNGCQTFEYFINGEVATAEQTAVIKSFIPSDSANKSQGLDEPVIVRTIKIGGIRRITVNGITSEF